MTTKVTIDTHAGYSVVVTTCFKDSVYTETYNEILVLPNTTKDIYIHSHLTIVGIEEIYD